MLFLADAEVASQLAGASAATSILVALLATLFAYMALRAKRRRDSPALKWVAAAFALFAVKNVFSAVNVMTHIIQHDAIELVLSVFDLMLLALLFVPFLRRKRA